MKHRFHNVGARGPDSGTWEFAYSSGHDIRRCKSYSLAAYSYSLASMRRPWGSCKGRELTLNRAAKARNCSRLSGHSCSKMNQRTPSVQGGTVSEPDIGPVAAVGGQQAAGIHHLRDFLGCAGFGGQVVPERGEHGVGRGSAVFAETDGDDRLLAVGALVDEVDVHVGELAFDRFFGGMVEVELDQVVAHAVGDDVAAIVDVDDDGVAVVLQRDGSGDVVELDGLEGLVEASAANVDGRLLVALGTGFVGGVQPAPGQRAALAS